MRTVIGVDAGGTSTRAALVDEAGTCWGLGRSGSGNPTSAGVDLAVASLVTACEQALAGLPVGVERPSVVLLTAAGVTVTGIEQRVQHGLAGIGLTSEVVIVGDLLGAFHSATAEPAGLVIVAGTGATTARVLNGELVACRDGVGWLIGDNGSGFWIGHRVVRAAIADMDGYGPPTALTAAVMEWVPNLSGPEPSYRDERVTRLMRYAYSIRPVELAAFAPLAFQVGPDPVAARIVAEAGDAVLGVAESLIDDDVAEPIVLAGGLLGDGSPIAVRLRERWPGRCLRAEDGTAGAALLGLRRIGIMAGEAELSRIRTTVDARRVHA